MATIICVASGSGGHIIPCLTIAEQEKKIRPDAHIVFITSRKKLDIDLVCSNPLIRQTYLQPVFCCRWWHFWRYPRLVRTLIAHFYESYALINACKPLKIVSMGGAISVPICLTAWLKGIPIELYELNAVPGKAVRFLSFFAQRIFICFSSANQYLKTEKCILTPYPLRFGRVVPKELLPLQEDKKMLLILGGSQGSQFINTFITHWLNNHPTFHRSFKIVHQTGADHAEKIRQFYEQHHIDATVFDFTDTIAPLYQQADIVVCRSGAGTLFELLFFEKKCITIPLEGIAGDHQSANAHALAHQYPHLLTVISQRELLKDPEVFTLALTMYFNHDGQLAGFEPNP